MATLRIHSEQETLQLDVPPGQSVREVLDSTALRVRAACGGSGTCGACRIRLIQGQVTTPTLAEYQKLTQEERAEGFRLACQMRLAGDTNIVIDDPAPPSPWRSIPPEHLLPAAGRLADLSEAIYGVAVDLGTTHIRVALWDRKQGRRIATRRGPNPQGVFGADVLNRITAALSSPERSAELSKLARTAIIQAVRDILARDVGEVSPMLARIGHVVIVGNTAMLALLTERGAEQLLAPEHWGERIDCQPSQPTAWQAGWPLPQARFSLPEPVAGFVGSDLLADLLATRLTAGPAGSMLLDVGTNTEIALWDGRRVFVTSVPGGPAFEAVGIRFGMPAEPGAIYRVRPATATSGYALATIGDGPARGFCGSGLADAIAVLRADGTLKLSGRFAVPQGAEGLRLDPASPRSAITGSDVDAFQRAKAATAAAMATLLKLAGMDWCDLRRLCVCGAFGHTLDIPHAQSVGLLPDVAPEHIELMADSTLAGCEMALLLTDGPALFQREALRIETVNLATEPGYDERYIAHLRLKPAPPVQ